MVIIPRINQTIKFLILERRIKWVESWKFFLSCFRIQPLKKDAPKTFLNFANKANCWNCHNFCLSTQLTVNCILNGWYYNKIFWINSSSSLKGFITQECFVGFWWNFASKRILQWHRLRNSLYDLFRCKISWCKFQVHAISRFILGGVLPSKGLVIYWWRSHSKS